MRQDQSRLRAWTAGTMFMALAAVAHGQNLSAGLRPTPPPEPAVRPIVSAPADLDRDRDRVDDRITSTVAAAQSTLARFDAQTTETAAARAALDERIEVELIFNRQITQAQIDAFLKAGGEISKVFSHVSYGWTGTIARRDAARLPGLLGGSLLGVLAKKEAILHMDEGGRTGRVRPQVWNSGITGQSSGANRITIAILDTGVDASHSDLTGRLQYWKDWTADNHATAQDKGHHGSHVAGIAVGTGASAGVSPATLSYMDLGNFPGTSGSFYPSPISIPGSLTSFNWTSDMRWKTGSGVQARLGHLLADTAGAYGLIGTYTSGNSSPLSETNNALASPNAGGTSRFSAYASKNSGGGSPDYAVANTISYTGVGDGYNALSGVAPDCAWAGFKVFEDNGAGSGIDIDEALDDLVAQRITHGIKVANMSLGFGGSYTPTRDKTNTAALNGVFICVSAGNSGADSVGVAGEVGDPGRAHYALTVASSSDVNQLTDYSSHGFTSPGDSSSGDEDMKPDIMAPGGSTGYQSNILSVDSNSSDAWDTNGSNFTDAVPDNYLNIQGTSMASPFAAGCAALVIDALQQSGETWDFAGGAALDDVLRVKQLLLLTATESNLAREAAPSGNPTLQRGGKDINEGYGMINPDAAVEALLNPPFSGGAFTANGTLGPGRFDKRCWARRVDIVAGDTVEATLTVPASGDFDLYLYGAAPDSYGNPVTLASSANAGNGVTETLTFPVAATQTGYLLVKRVSGGSTSAGDSWILTGDLGGVDETSPTVTAVAAQSERTIDVTFSEGMGAGVTVAGNYTVSGAGVGTLSASPAGVALVSGNTYRITWSAPEEMLNGVSVTVTAAGISDFAGNLIGTPDSGSSSGIGSAPSIILSSAAADSTAISPVLVTATLSESAINFTDTDVSVSNATVANFTGSGTIYTFELTPAEQGAVTASVAAASFSDAAGNANTASAVLSRTYDSVAPSATLSTVAPNPTSGSPVPVTVALSESSVNFTAADVTVANGAVQNFSGSGTAYSFDLVPSAQGTVTASVAAATFTDAAANPNTSSNVLSRTYDSVAPTVTLTTDAAEPTSAPTVAVTVTLSESSGNFTAADLVTVNAAVQNFSGSAADYAFELLPSGQGTVSVSVPAGAFTDSAANANTASNLLVRTYDSVGPVVSSVTAIDRNNADISFLEANAITPDVTSATMYALSGDGAGTVTATPDAVAMQSGHTYRLTWNTGEMVAGQPFTITVQNGPLGIHDAAGNPMGEPSTGSTLAVPATLSSFSAE